MDADPKPDRNAERERPLRRCPTAGCPVEYTTAEHCPDCGAATVK